MHLIDARDITKTYPDGTKALAGVSLKIKEGEFVAIMGPSGSGKSTLLHILGLLDPPSTGEYFLDSKEIGQYSKSEVANARNKKLGFVFQAFNLLARTSVLENVKLPLLYSGIPEKLWDGIAHKAISDVGLTYRLKNEPSELSGGEKQRVAIARALVNNPKVIFADEPTGNLDTKAGNQVMEILVNLNKAGRTVILITHENETARFAERIIKLRDGKMESDEQVAKRRNISDDGEIK